jgi:hypothetical protein
MFMSSTKTTTGQSVIVVLLMGGIWLILATILVTCGLLGHIYMLWPGWPGNIQAKVDR